ncbi:2TM domain-containing protein [Prochlorothrix hollandica]|uniref:2TM domain-containing protein n=1 Tax=Prochlorothrix hollandica TaxID=1223 RepID=UPI00034891F3|nr:2TM domain-containing protein [Prochlorothrix hollandica]
MPPRWPRTPDRNDPAFRRLEDFINFALHAAIYLAVNSGLWFFQLLNHPWDNLSIVSGVWLLGLVSHGCYVFILADYRRIEAAAQGNWQQELATELEEDATVTPDEAPSSPEQP